MTRFPENTTSELKLFYDPTSEEWVYMAKWPNDVWVEGQRKPAYTGKTLAASMFAAHNRVLKSLRRQPK